MWLLLLIVYSAPPGAVDWDGPWTFMTTQVNEHTYSSEAQCRTNAIQIIGRAHQGMLVPIRYRCVQADASLPIGAPR